MPEARPHEFLWVVPLRRVFPWWYLLGVVVTVAVPAVLGLGTAGVTGVWGAAIGITVQDRWRRAAARQAAGLPVTRRDLVGPPWEDPVVALVGTAAAVGLSWALGFVFGGVPVSLRWTGVGLLVGAAVSGVAIVLIGARREAASPRPR